MPPDPSLYRWHEINDVPCKTGVYAWYCRHTLTDFDIDNLVAELSRLPPSAAKEAAARVRKFFDTNLFGPFLEQPYEATLKGPLKPTYRGTLSNSAIISAALVDRIVADPSRLRHLKNILEDAVPSLASPIYIGMSDNLHDRLSRHKTLIAKYKSAIAHPADEASPTDSDDPDHSFARDVVRRGFSTNALVVAIRLVEAPRSVHLDAENILNRINYPLCGRN